MLSEQIRDGQLKRGDKLPTESAIMDAHGVSRTVVREAISRLQAAGQVETRHGIGTFVLDTPSPSGFRIDPATVVTLRDVLAILELRISLEVESAGLAALRRSDEQLAAMRAALDALNESAAHAGDAVASDFAFHLEIALSTGNRYFTDIMTHLGTSIIPRTRLNSARLAHDDQQHYMGRLSREHEEIYDAGAQVSHDVGEVAVAGGQGNLQVELEVRRHRITGVSRTFVQGIEGSTHAGQLLVATTLGGKPGRLHFQADPQFKNGQYIPQGHDSSRVDPETAGAWRIQHKGTDAMAGFHLPGRLQSRDGFTHHGAADPMGVHDRRLSGQFVTTFELAVADLLGQHRDQFLGKAAALAGKTRGGAGVFHDESSVLAI